MECKVTWRIKPFEGRLLQGTGKSLVVTGAQERATVAHLSQDLFLTLSSFRGIFVFLKSSELCRASVGKITGQVTGLVVAEDDGDSSAGGPGFVIRELLDAG